MGFSDRIDREGISRRHFLISAGLVSGAFVIGPHLVSPAEAAETFSPNAFVRIPPSGPIELVIASAEMGQGVYMGIATLIAEELEVSLDQVVAVPAPADPSRYAHPFLGDQITGGSVTIRGFWEPMRQAGAAARIMLIAAAAKEWNVPASECRAEKGEVVHASGKRLAYGALSAKAAAETVPTDVPLKPASDFRLIGKTGPRLDAAGKVNGSARFGLDARPAGVKFAAIALSPTFGGTLGDVDDKDARAVKGVRQIVRLSDAVAVIADHTGAARKGLAALKITWVPGANGDLTSAELERRIDAAMEGETLLAHNTGDVDTVEGTKSVDATYRLPILAHSAMEPMNCTLHVRADGCDVWVGTQVAGRARQAVADLTGLALEKVVAHNHLLGGGFGRRLDHDGVVMATRVAQQVEGPVQVIWSREEDIRHDSFRYLNRSRVSIKLGPDGMPIAWNHRVAGPAVMARFLQLLFKDGIDLDITNGAQSPYDIPNKRVEYARHEAPDGMLTGNWRGVGPTRNAPAVEGGIDEAAHLAGRDPVEYRRQLLAGNPRLRGVLDLAAEKADWKTPLGSGWGRGIALLTDFGSYAALVAEIHADPAGSFRIARFVCAVDCGHVINPGILRQQIESGIIYGLSAALHGRLTIANGAVVEGNFDDQPVVRIHESPPIEVHIVPSTEDPGGIGEVGTPGVAPALMNAIFAATGKRLRDLPLDLTQLSGA